MGGNSKVFISYSHKDEAQREYVEEHLSVLSKQDKLTFWSDRKIKPGKDWRPEIDKELSECKVAVLLISRHFLSSNFIMDDEVPLLLERRERGELEIFMLMLTPCAWQEVEWVAKIQGFPKDNIPLSKMSENDRDEAMVDFVLAVNEECKLPAAPTEAPRRKKPFNVPFESKNEGAIGIEEKLIEVHDALQDPKSHKANIGQVAAFQGMGGLGKTQLAVEYAHRYRDEYDGVVWLTVDQDIDRQIVELAESVGWVAREVDAKVKLDISRAGYADLENVLLVYDNVENYDETVAPLIPKSNNNHILLTSRADIGGFRTVKLATLCPQDSLRLLEHESGREVTEAERSSVDALIEALDGLPLAVEMAGAYMLDAEISWEEYWKLFQKQSVTFLENSPLRNSGTNHESNISKTLSIGEAILDRTPHLEDVIHLLAFGAPGPMDKTLLSRMLSIDEAEIALAIQKGVKLKFIKKEDEDEAPLYTLHRLVREVWRSQREPGEGFGAKVSENLAAYLHEVKDEFLNLPMLEMASFQAKVWAMQVADTDTSTLLSCYAVYPDYYMGRYSEALSIVEEAYDHIDTDRDSEAHAEVLNDRAFLLDSLGQPDTALPDFKEALEMRRRLYGESDHPDVARSLSNMGGVLDSLGQPDKALSYYEEALEMLRRLYGESDHPDVARSLSNMGYVLQSLRQPDKALPYYEEALGMRGRLYGESDHPDVAISLNNMGYVLQSLRQPDKALPYYEEALGMRGRLYGESDHPDVAISLNNMGYVLQSLRQPDKALPYYEEALGMRGRLYGESDHPDVAISLNNVGALLRDKKKCNEAHKLLTEAKEMMERLGYDPGLLRTIKWNLKDLEQKIKKESKLSFKKKGRYCVE